MKMFPNKKENNITYLWSPHHTISDVEFMLNEE
jgi:hypothetical protein